MIKRIKLALIKTALTALNVTGSVAAFIVAMPIMLFGLPLATSWDWMERKLEHRKYELERELENN